MFDDEDTEHLGHDADVYGTDSRSNYLRTLGDPEDDIPTPRTQKKTDVAASRSGSSVGGGLFGFVAATGDSGRVQERVFVLPPPPREYRCMHVFTEKEDAEFAAMRALVGGGPVSRPQQPMSTLTRAALLGEKLTLPVPPQAPPVPSPVAAPTLPAILSESRFVASSVPGTMYTARDVGGGGLMSKKEFEEK